MLTPTPTPLPHPPLIERTQVPSQVSDTVDDFYAEAVRFLSHNRHMAASDHLSPQQFFHGTIETLKPGDIIKPRLSGHAWASTDLPAVVEHTRDRTISGLGAADSDGEWPVHHGNVYEVEPVDHAEVGGPGMSATAGAVASKKGFKVKSQVASVLGTDNQRKDAKQYFPDFDPSKESYVKNGRKFGRE